MTNRTNELVGPVGNAGRIQAAASTKSRLRTVVAATAAVVLPAASLASVVVVASPAEGVANGVTEFAIPTADANPQGIAAGPDGALWFAENATSTIGRVTPAGEMTEISLPEGSGPQDITAAPGGAMAMWFTENAANRIGRIDLTTVPPTITEFAVTTADSGPLGITAGPDGNVWFTETAVGQIGRISPTGTVNEFANPADPDPPLASPVCCPTEITTGPDANLWFTDTYGFQIGRITPAGTMTTFPTPAVPGSTDPVTPAGITPGPAGDSGLWFTDSNSSTIGRISTDGAYTYFPVPSPGAGPQSITVGPDANMWFTEPNADRIGRISPDGQVAEFTLPDAGSGPFAIAGGPAGNTQVWFTEGANRIGALATDATPFPGITAVSPSSGPSSGGSSLTIAGVNLAGATSVSFSQPDPRGSPRVLLPAVSFTADPSGLSVTAIAPALPGGRYDITVATPDGTTLVVAADQFVSLAPLLVSSLRPSSGEPLGGNTVTIVGSGFTTATAVDFGPAPASSFKIDSDTQITAISPPGTDGTTVDVRVTAAQGISPVSSGSAFRFQLVPVTITNINPKGGSPLGGGAPILTNPSRRSTVVTVTGTGFVKVTAVKFGTVPAAKFSVDSETQITAVSPIAPQPDNTTVDIQVTAVQGTSPPVPADRFTYSAKPILDYFLTSAASPAAGGAAVRVKGVHLSGATAVSFGDQTVTCPSDCSVQSDTEISVTAPPNPIGSVLVKITNADGTSLVGLPFAYTGIGTVAGTGSCDLATSACAEVGVVRLSNGKILGVGAPPSRDPDQAHSYDPATGVWTAGAACNGCGGRVLALLPDGPPSACAPNCGKVLMVGRTVAAANAVATAFLYDPVANTWTKTAGDPVFMGFDTATVLPGGKVLVTANSSLVDRLSPDFGRATELYDPTTDSFTATGRMNHEHLNAAATLLADGTVLIDGNGGSGTKTPLSGSAEVYDPASGVWHDTASMIQARFAHTSTLLPDGRVLVAGGEVNFLTNITLAEIYTPATTSAPASWSIAAPMTFARYGHSATPLPDGRVLVAGGDQPQTTAPDRSGSGNNPSVGEVFDPASDTWTPTPPLVSLQETQGFNQAHEVRSLLLPDGPSCTAQCGRVLVIRGRNLGNLSIPATPTDVIYTPNRAASAVSLTPTSVGFGSQAVGSISEAMNVTLTNTGGTPLVVSAIRMGGANPAAFVTTADTCTATSVAAAGTCTVGVRFAPGVAGSASASLDFVDDASDSPQRVGLSGTGTLPSAGGASTSTPATPPTTAPEVAASSRTGGYRLVGSDGGVFAFGAARFLGSAGALRLNSPVVGMSSTPSGNGYRLVAADGGLFAFGDAGFFGSTGGIHLNQAIVGMAATPTGKGYWLVGADGGIFAFGDAAFFGSTGGIHLNQAIVGMAATPTGKGYWLVGADGGIFAFGDARFRGSTGATRLNHPVVGMASSRSGSGYWLVASDGGVFAFGDSRFEGSTGSLRLSQPVAGIEPTPDGTGYWLVASDGGVFAFGDAAFLGSSGALRLNRPIMGMSSSG